MKKVIIKDKMNKMTQSLKKWEDVIMKIAANENDFLNIVVKIIRGKNIYFKVWGGSRRMYVCQAEATIKDGVTVPRD